MKSQDNYTHKDTKTMTSTPDITTTKVVGETTSLCWEMVAFKATQLNDLFKLPYIIKEFGVCKATTEECTVSDGTSYDNPVPGYLLVVMVDSKLSEDHIKGVKDVIESV